MAKMQALHSEPISSSPPPSPPSSLPSLHNGSATLLNPSNISFPKSQAPRHRTHLSVLKNPPLNSCTYASLIDSCQCLSIGKQIHGHTLKTGFHGHEFVETKLLQMYAKFGGLMDACLLFDKMLLRNLYSWMAILGVHVDHGLFEEAFLLFEELLFEEIRLEFFVFPLVLKICSGLGALELGRQLHGMVVKYQFVSNIYLGNALIDMYGKCKSLHDAKNVLNKMPSRDCVSWNSFATACASNGMVYEALECLDKMSALDNSVPNLVSWSTVIGGLSQNGYDEDAVELLSRMRASGLEPNAHTLASVLPACARLQRLCLGKEIHCYITRRGYTTNSFVVNGLVDVYRRCYDMRSARRIFSKLSVKNSVSFNTMIVGYCETGEISKARKLFDQMEPMGIQRDIISWNSLISGYVDNCLFDEALSMFLGLLMEEKAEADSFTLGSIITACTNSNSLRQGKMIHSYAIVRALHSNPFVGGALVEMYCKCRNLRAARMAFDAVNGKETATWNALLSGYACCSRMDDIENLMQKMKGDGYTPNVYTWNGIIAGHVENGHHELALKFFSEMQTSNLRPDIYTVGIILPACTKLSMIEQGKQVHAHSIRCAYDTDVHIGTALVDMYAKCGSIDLAGLAFNRISNPNLVSQNVMLTAYAMHGRGIEGIRLFRKMHEDGIVPDQVTFLSVLSSCVHAGSVESGHEYFDLMRQYNLKPTIKHYTCMIDLLSRAGQVDKAYDVIKKMPIEPDSVVWGALLGGCITCGDVELGEVAAERLLELDPESTGNYVLLANLYASAGRWCDLARTRQIIKDKGMHKNPGCSWIVDRDEIHVFLGGDRSHERIDEIYGTLNHLNVHMKKGALDLVI